MDWPARIVTSVGIVPVQVRVPAEPLAPSPALVADKEVNILVAPTANSAENGIVVPLAVLAVTAA